MLLLVFDEQVRNTMGCRTSKMPTAGAICATARTDACLDAFGLPYDAPGSPVAPIEIATFDDQPTEFLPRAPKMSASRPQLHLLDPDLDLSDEVTDNSDYSEYTLSGSGDSTDSLASMDLYFRG